LRDTWCSLVSQFDAKHASYETITYIHKLETPKGPPVWKKDMLKNAETNVAGRNISVTMAMVRILIASHLVSSAIVVVALESVSAIRLKYSNY
jgi:hypothetical protein